MGAKMKNKSINKFLVIVYTCFINFKIVNGDQTCSGLRTLRRSGCTNDVILKIPSDGSGVYHFVLNASIQTYSNTNMDVQLQNKQAVKDGTTAYLTYVVRHPTCRQYPRVTRLEFNGQVLCRNPPYDVSNGLPATQLYFTSTHYGKRRRVISNSQTFNNGQLVQQQFMIPTRNNLVSTVSGDETCSGMRTLRKSACSYDVLLNIPSDGSGTYNFVLNASMPIYSNENLHVRLENENAVKDGSANHLTYAISHPNCGSYPLVTRLEFNGRVICVNEPYRAKPGQAATQLYFQSTHHGAQRPKNNGNNFFNFNQFTKDFTNFFNGQNFFGGQTTPMPVQNQQPGFFLQFGAPNPNNPFLQNLGPQNTLTTPKATTTTATTTTRRPRPAVSVQHSAENLCGYSTTPLIQGGDNVQPGEYTWLGALFTLNRNKLNYICTVNLISARHVLTAAHCVIDNQYKPNIYRIVFGHLPEEEREYLRISAIEIHPEYVKTNTTHDAAVMTIAGPVIDNFPKPICVWQSTLTRIPGSGLIAGFGPDYTSFRKVLFPIVTQEECRGSHIQFHYVTSDFTFCAGTRDRRGPCLGDSGAGFMQYIGQQYFLRGLVSHSLSANNNCNLEEYVIFTDLAKETNWLQRVLVK